MRNRGRQTTSGFHQTISEVLAASLILSCLLTILSVPGCVRTHEPANSNLHPALQVSHLIIALVLQASPCWPSAFLSPLHLVTQFSHYVPWCPRLPEFPEFSISTNMLVSSSWAVHASCPRTSYQYIDPVGFCVSAAVTLRVSTAQAQLLPRSGLQDGWQSCGGSAAQRGPLARLEDQLCGSCSIFPGASGLWAHMHVCVLVCAHVHQGVHTHPTRNRHGFSMSLWPTAHAWVPMCSCILSPHPFSLFFFY